MLTNRRGIADIVFDPLANQTSVNDLVATSQQRMHCLVLPHQDILFATS